MVAGSNTPAMRQYMEAKAAHPDALLFFRMGDFYELFFDDAIEAARLLELTLTSRNKKSDQPIPMAGVPHHAARGYVQRLVDSGRKVAICEQVEDPKQAKGVVKRAVTHVVTPGVNLEDDALPSNMPNYLMAFADNLEGYHLAYADVSTGEFRATSLPTLDAARDEISRLQPRELLIPSTSLERHTPLDTIDVLITRLDATEPTMLAGDNLLAALETEGSREAAQSLYSYLNRMHPTASKVLRPAESYSLEAAMHLEEATLINLEVLQTMMTGQRRGSLLGLMDKTSTAMGARALRHWLQTPLISTAAIRARQDAVEALVNDTIRRGDIRERLQGVYDLERLSGRLLTGMASPKDLAALRNSLQRLPELLSLLQDASSKKLRKICRETDALEDIRTDLETTLADNIPMTLKEGGVIRTGVDAALDELRSLSKDGKDWLLRYEAQEREAAGINSLKVRYNKVFGYYIEVSKANVHLVPEHYVRKQTLVNAERYFTETLKEYEDKILSAEERMATLEAELFETLRGRISDEARRITDTARQVAELDVYAGLAELAQEKSYCRPEVNRSRDIILKGARHAVIESMMEDGSFVPNDIELSKDSGNFMLITGPNMAGKSTVMRQVALIALMAQVGSYVPAEAATLGLVDRIFTRVGASDNLSRGQSTFMVEMTETATILKHATDRSLVILDEIGRGTSTYDGLSIAWAVVEHLHNHLKARTLFATHYHELTVLEEEFERLVNQHIAVREFNDEIIFLHKLMPGGTNRSYGIQVGRLAGLPKSVITRAKDILRSLESASKGTSAPDAASNPSTKADSLTSMQMSLFGGTTEPSEVEKALKEIHPDALSPLEAIQVLYKLKALASEDKNSN